MCKFSFHFNKDQAVFFKEADRCLKSSGKLLIAQVGKGCKLPWSLDIQANFEKLLSNTDDYIPEELFQWKFRKENRMVKLGQINFQKFCSSKKLEQSADPYAGRDRSMLEVN